MREFGADSIYGAQQNSLTNETKIKLLEDVSPGKLFPYELPKAPTEMYVADFSFKMFEKTEQKHQSNENTDDALKNANQTFDRLQNINLNGSDVSDKGLEHLRPASKLRDLCLSNTKITDEGLKTLSKLGLKELDSLDLSATDVTDAGLEALKQIPSLTSLSLRSISGAAQPPVLRFA